MKQVYRSGPFSAVRRDDWWHVRNLRALEELSLFPRELPALRALLDKLEEKPKKQRKGRRP